MVIGLFTCSTSRLDYISPTEKRGSGRRQPEERIHCEIYGCSVVRRYRASRSWASGRSWGSGDCLITADMECSSSWPVDCLSPPCKSLSVRLRMHIQYPSACRDFIVRVSFSTMCARDLNVPPAPGHVHPIISSDRFLTRSGAARRRCAHGARHWAFT